ncbi:DNA-directed RNA polymerase subunit epsilon [Haloarchaeobius sp. HRN-SO-5]|uniref:DNA-directed RNA polymerase subunit epsilon n=1 Tax=Haloarchaeobius sp. HRN-SO-5 TaxID=3446118 RepID=UPI003EBAE713
MTRSPASSEPPADGQGDPRFDRDVSTAPGDGALSRLDAVKDERIRRWDIVTPSATLIGRTSDPTADVSENLRRLHDEQHPAMQGHSARMHRLEKARITHAFCNTLSLTPWERDRALGIVVDLDMTVFGSQRAIPKVALVVIQHVVDDERKRRLGLHDDEWVAERSPDELQSLSERFESLKADDRYRDLLDRHGLDVTSVNRLGRTLREQLDEQDLGAAALGRSPYRDPSMPAIRSEPPADDD